MTERSHSSTLRLYETDPHLTVFTAAVLGCCRTDKGYDVVLNQTAFFPTGGGQPCDGGTLGGYPVLDVRIETDTVRHTLPSPLPLGGTVTGVVDQEPRLRRMANHSGEHLLSAVLAKRHGLRNVGFHMGSRDVTCDFDGIIDDEALRTAEDEVNRLIRENHPITSAYPSPETLATLDYRSKLDLTEHVRIVSIGENGTVDRCACCAPHVTATGEIGILRIVEREHYKGGLRLHILCGADALERIREEADCIVALSTLLSAKPEGGAIQEAVRRLWEEHEGQKENLSFLNDVLNETICQGLDDGSPFICHFDLRDDAVALRKLAALANRKTGTPVAVFGGSDTAGYKLVLCADSGLKARYASLTKLLPCRGGGSDSLICGSVKADRAAIEAACLTVFS